MDKAEMWIDKLFGTRPNTGVVFEALRDRMTCWNMGLTIAVLLECWTTGICNGMGRCWYHLSKYKA
jgi:hypothetical protein